MNVIEILDESAARSPAATALAWGAPGAEDRISFADLGERSRRLAALFRREGLVPGDAVAILLPMAGPLYGVMAAVLRAGMCPVFPDPSSWRETLDAAQQRMPVRAMVASPLACAIRPFIPELRRIPVAFCAGVAVPGATSLREAARCAPLVRVEDRAREDVALLSFTSGSTGTPKGVLRSHGMLEATHRILARELELAAGEAHVAVLPFFVFAHLGSGATTVMPRLDARRPADLDAAALERQVRAWNARSLAGSPFLMGRLEEACKARGAPLDSLRKVFAGGAAVWPALLDRIGAMAPRADVAAVYGSTEAEPIALVRRGEWREADRAAMAEGRGVLAGTPIAEARVRVVEDRWPGEWAPCTPAEFDRATRSPGTEGEIVVAGPHVSAGYLSPQDTARNKVIVDGEAWHRTGDAGYFDADGRLWLVGRCAARVGAIYPLRVEAALASSPGIARGTLVAAGAERVLAIERSAAAPAVDPREAAARLAWCGADRIVEMQRIPVDRRHHAKIDVRALRACLRGARSL